MGYFRSSHGRTWKNGFRGRKRKRRRLRAVLPPAVNSLGLAPAAFGEMVDVAPATYGLGPILSGEIFDVVPPTSDVGPIASGEMLDAPPEALNLAPLLVGEVTDGLLASGFGPELVAEIYDEPGASGLGPLDLDELVELPALPPLLRFMPGSPVPVRVDDTTGDGVLIPVIMGLPGTLPTRRLHTDGYATSLELGGSNIVRVTLGTKHQAGELEFRARGSNTPLSDPGASRLVGFLATTIIGAINEVRAASVSAAFPFVNGEATPLLQYEIVRPGATSGQVLRAVASSDGIAARVIGFVKDAVIAAGASGYVTTVGLTRIRLVAGLVVAPGQDVFLSASVAGRGTNTAPNSSGNVIVPLGTITNALSYDGVTDLVVELQANVRAPLLVVQ